MQRRARHAGTKETPIQGERTEHAVQYLLDRFPEGLDQRFQRALQAELLEIRQILAMRRKAPV